MATDRARSEGTEPSARPRLAPVIFTGGLLGIGIAGFVDESIFHQLLQWHNFYWATDERGRILSDGLFHVGSTLVLLWGALRLWFDRGSWTQIHSRAILAGILLGAGGFNTYDGVVQHVIFHLHLVNERVCRLPMANNSIMSCRADIPYEVVWILIGALVLGAGVALVRRALTTDVALGAR
jgi:uncharacterized membrane protein